jgi:hypothetical protein
MGPERRLSQCQVTTPTREPILEAMKVRPRDLTEMLLSGRRLSCLRRRFGRERVDHLARLGIVQFLAGFPFDGMRIGFELFNPLLESLILLRLQRVSAAIWTTRACR